MRTRVVAVMATLLLAGCATPGVGWSHLNAYKPNGTLMEQAEAFDACTKNPREDRTACLRKRGYSIVMMYWYKVGGTEQSFEADMDVCLSTTNDPDTRALGTVTATLLTALRCVEKRGWSARLKNELP
jgi:hypothetical protein